MFFSESTHRLRWILSEEELLRVRTELHNSQFFTDEAQHQDKKHEGAAADSDTASGAMPVVTLGEVLRLLKYYESRVASICDMLRLPKKVQATSLMYFKRYYLTGSLLDLEPLRVLLTCIYLAAKIEESYVSAEELGKATDKDPNIVLRTEVAVLTALRFDLVVHSPYRALAGLFQDIDDMRSGSTPPSSSSAAASSHLLIDPELTSASADDITQCRRKAAGALDALMLTDAPLLYPPATIALAALRSGCRSRGIKLSTYLLRVAASAAGLPQSGGMSSNTQSDEPHSPSSDEQVLSQQVVSLTAKLDDLDALGMQGALKVDQQEVTEVDRKIKQCKALNPLNDPASLASRSAQAAEARQKAERREAKLRARKEAAAAEEAQLLGTTQQLPRA